MSSGSEAGTRRYAGHGNRCGARAPRKLFIAFLLVCAGAAMGAPKEEAKMVTGMSIVGNNEAPKSLYIVPWKSSETGADNGLSSSLLNEKLMPVDRQVFMRELNFYELSNAK